MKFTAEEKNIVDQLLSSDENKVKAALQADIKQRENVLRAVELVWQLHPDEDIRSMAEGLLKNIGNPQQSDAVNRSFEIFRSLNEVLPWMQDNAAEVQQDNFKLFQPALSEYEYLLSNYPLYSELLLDAGRKLLMLHHLEDEAYLCFETIVGNNPENDEALYALGRMAERKGQFERALELYERAIGINQDNSFAQMQAGLLKSTVFEKHEEAIAHFNAAATDDPYAVEPYVRIAEAAYRLNDIPRCRQYLEIALGINEYQEEALDLLGTVQWKVDQKFDEAVATFQKGIDHKIHNDSARLLKSLGDINAEHFQDFRKARVFYEKSLKINPAQKELVQLYTELVLKNFQDLGAAEQCYLDFLKNKADDADVLTAYAAFLVQYLNDYESAHKRLQEAISADPDHAEANKLMRRIEEYVQPESEEEEEEDDESEDIIYLDELEEDGDDDDDDDDDFSGGSAAGDN